MRGMCALGAVMLVGLVAASPAAAERGLFTQLPPAWQQLFLSEAEIVSLEAFPMIEAPTDGQPLPFAVPGTPRAVMEPEVTYEAADGAVDSVSVQYRLSADSTWTADGRALELWAAQFRVSVRLHPTEQGLAALFAEGFDADEDSAVSLGDEAFFIDLDEDYAAQLEVRTGRYEVAVHLEVAPGIFRGVAVEPLRELAQQWAGVIVGRITGQPPAATPKTSPALLPAAPGRLAVRAEAPGFAALTQQITLPAATTPGEITLRVAVRTVLDGVAVPLAGASVALPEYGVTALTSTEGTVVLRARGAGQTPVVAMLTFDLQPATETASAEAADGTEGEAEGQTQTGGATTTGTGAAETLPTAPAPLGPLPLVADSAVRRAVVCQGVDEQGELVGCLDVFPAGTEKVSLYLEIVGAPPNSEIQITWYLDGEAIGRELLLVSGDRRALSFLYARGRATLWGGAYAAEISENGRVVGRLVFRVEGEG